jgi:hypothetical protein
MVVVDPMANLFDLVGGYRAAGSMGLIQRDTQIPYRPVLVTAGALAGRTPAGQIALPQGATQDFAERRNKLGEPFAPPVKGEDGKPGQILPYSQVAVRIIAQPLKIASANLSPANLLLSH